MIWKVMLITRRIFGRSFAQLKKRVAKYGVSLGKQKVKSVYKIYYCV